MANKDKPKETKKITNIQQWVVCFNAYISVMAVRHPGRVQDLLAYSSIITKASLDYEGVPWLLYDAHFRRAAAAAKCKNWAQVDASIWTMYFTSANLSRGGVAGLAVVPAPTGEDTHRKKATTPRGAKSTQRGRYSPLGPPFQSVKTGITRVAQTSHAGSGTSEQNVVPQTIHGRTATKCQLPPRMTSMPTQGLPFRTVAPERVASEEPVSDHSTEEL